MSNLSITPMRAYYDKRISQEDIILLGVICNHTDANGFCFPSLARLSLIYSPAVGRAKPYDDSSISKKINRLVDFGYLTVEKRKTAAGSYKSNGYKIVLDALLPLEFDRREIQASLESVTDENQASLENPLGEIQTNDPIERPNRTGSGAKNAPPPEEAEIEFPPVEPRQKRTIADAKQAIGNALQFYAQHGDQSSKSDPNAERKVYRREIGQALGRIFGHAPPTTTDVGAAGKLYGMKFPLDRALAFCQHHANGAGERYRTATTQDGKPLNAYHVIGDMDDWRAGEYKEFPAEKQEFSGRKLA